MPPLAHCYLGDDITDDDALAALSSGGFTVDRPPDIAAAMAGLHMMLAFTSRTGAVQDFAHMQLGPYVARKENA